MIRPASDEGDESMFDVKTHSATEQSLVNLKANLLAIMLQVCQIYVLEYQRASGSIVA
jgi:hypothetical protein